MDSRPLTPRLEALGPTGQSTGGAAEAPAAPERGPERRGAGFVGRALGTATRSGAEVLLLQVGRAEVEVLAEGAAPAVGSRVRARVLAPARLPSFALLDLGGVPQASGAGPAPRSGQGAAPVEGRVLARFPDSALLLDTGAAVRAVKLEGRQAAPTVGQRVLLSPVEPGQPAQVALAPLLAPAAATALAGSTGDAAQTGKLLLALAAGLRARLAHAPRTPAAELISLFGDPARSQLGGEAARRFEALLPQLGARFGAGLADLFEGRRRAQPGGGDAVHPGPEAEPGASERSARAQRGERAPAGPEAQASDSPAERTEPLVVHLPLPDAERPAWFALSSGAHEGESGGAARIAFGVEFANTGPVRVEALGLGGRFALTLRFADGAVAATAREAADELTDLLAATGVVQRLEILHDPAGALTRPGPRSPAEAALAGPAPTHLDRTA